MSSQAQMAMLIKLPFKKRCELPDCGTAKDNLYKVNLDKENNALFCSTNHARIAVDRWQEKVKLGIKPGMPRNLAMEKADAVAENIPDEN